MLGREISTIAATCTVVLGTWLAFAIFMFDWDVGDLEGLLTSRKPPPMAFVMRGSITELPAGAKGSGVP